MSEKGKNVCSEVVAHDLCIGCGMCAGVCPRETLEIKFNKFSEYNAVDVKGDCDGCGVCLKVCPFSDEGENEDTLGKELFADITGVRHSCETGYYLGSFSGYSNVDGHRASGASGGLATWAMETLLESGAVDNVVCVGAVEEPEKLYKFVVCSTVEEIRGCSKSCYWPVETSEVVRHILSHEGRYAVIGLPCFVKAFRLAMKANKKLGERVVCLSGLVCGQLKSKFFAEYICSLGGGNPAGLKEFAFRIKDENRPASDFGMRFVCEQNDQRHEGVVFWTEGMNGAWDNRYFTPNACDYCDDVFAELADAVFMDAWLRDYVGDWAGTNLVLVRDPKLRDLFREGCNAGQIQAEPIDIESVIKSQWSGLIPKRKKLAWRLAVAKWLKLKVPAKRVKSVGVSFGELLKAYFDIKRRQKSKSAFLEQKRRGIGLEVFNKEIGIYDWFCTFLFGVERFWNKVKRAISR